MYYVASTWRRIFAFMIDAILFCLFLLPCLTQGVMNLLSKGVFSVHIFLILGAVGLNFAYRVFFLYFFQGTLGQLFLGLRVKSIHSEVIEVSFEQAFIRALVASLYIFLKWLPFVTALFSQKRRHLVDFIAETEVVQLPVYVKQLPRRYVLGSVVLLFTLTSGVERAYWFLSNTTVEAGFLKWSPSGIEFNLNDVKNYIFQK